MEALAITYMIIGVLFITAFSLRRYKKTSGKSLPKRLKSTFIPHVNLKNMIDKKESNTFLKYKSAQ